MTDTWYRIVFRHSPTCLWAGGFCQMYKGNSVEKEQPFQQLVLEELDIVYKKTTCDQYLTPYTELIWIRGLRVKPKTIKLLEKKIGDSLITLG